MKTPREILLKRHQPANAQLDLVRRKVIADECTAKNIPSPDPQIFSPLWWAAKLWRELILPARYVWSGLAAAWLLIAAVAVATHDTAPVVAKTASPPQGVQEALYAQQQLRAELIGRIEPIAADKPKERPLSPRSEQRPETRLV